LLILGARGGQCHVVFSREAQCAWQPPPRQEWKAPGSLSRQWLPIAPSHPVHLSVRVIVGSFSPPRSKGVGPRALRDSTIETWNSASSRDRRETFECDFAVPNWNSLCRSAGVDVQVLRRE
jgi:hypothetical protein